MNFPVYSVDITVPKGLTPSLSEDKVITLSVTPALMTVKNMTFWVIAQYNKETGDKIDVDEEFIIVSKDRQMWTQS